MAEPADRRKAEGTRADSRTSVAQVGNVTVGAATAASTVLYLMGCYKGGQLYSPDDALLLQWCAWMVPVGLWVRQNLGIIGDIITKKLRRAEEQA